MQIHVKLSVGPVCWCKKTCNKKWEWPAGKCGKGGGVRCCSRGFGFGGGYGDFGGGYGYGGGFGGDFGGGWGGGKKY